MRNHGEQHILGSSSAIHFTNRLDPRSEALEPSAEQANVPILPSRPISSKVPDLPPYDQVLQFYAAQQTQVNLMFAFLEPDDFQRKLDVVYSAGLDLARRDHVLSLCQVLLVVAFGMMYSVNTWASKDGPPGFTYFKQALMFVPAVYEGGSVQLVEVICYCAYYLSTINKHDTAFLYVSLTLLAMPIKRWLTMTRLALEYEWLFHSASTRLSTTHPWIKQKPVTHGEYGGLYMASTGSCP